MYFYAQSAPAGHVIDIGPAQGGSTIAYALGLRDSNKPFKVFSIEKGVGSDALATKDQGLNEHVLRKKILKYGVAKNTEVIMKPSHEAFASGEVATPIGILSIDADGALDRDFNLFYNNLAAGGVVVLDDVEDMVNRHGQTLLEMTGMELDEYCKSKNCTDLAQLTPLGKEYITYRFVKYLEEQGLIKIEAISGRNTVFAKKPNAAQRFEPEHYQAMQALRQQIKEEFWALRKRGVE